MFSGMTACPSCGPAPARNVVLDDVMPKGLSLVGATTATQGTCNATDATKLHCDLGTLRAGTVASITYSARIAADAKGTVVNKAVVKSDTDDRNPTDNEGTRPIDIAQPVQVSDTPRVSNPNGEGPSGVARTGLGHLTLVLLQAGIGLLVSGTLLYEISRLGPEDDLPA